MPNDGQVAAMDRATLLDDIGFPEFTSKLVSDTFSAIVGSLIHQQEASPTQPRKLL